MWVAEAFEQAVPCRIRRLCLKPCAFLCPREPLGLDVFCWRIKIHRWGELTVRSSALINNGLVSQTLIKPIPRLKTFSVVIFTVFFLLSRIRLNPCLGNWRVLTNTRRPCGCWEPGFRMPEFRNMVWEAVMHHEYSHSYWGVARHDTKQPCVLYCFYENYNIQTQLMTQYDRFCNSLMVYACSDAVYRQAIWLTHTVLYLQLL